MAEVIYTYENPSPSNHLERACQVLKDDGLIAVMTDVHWAIVCDYESIKALRRLKPEKKTDQHFSVLCSSLSMVASIAQIDSYAYRVLRKSLPGPYTFLLPRIHALPKQMRDKRKTVGIRVPARPFLLDLIEMYGSPLATTSMPGKPGSEEGDPQGVLKFGYEVEMHFGHELDLILDLGGESEGLQTTVVDFSEGAPVILRVGAGVTDGIL